MYHVLGQVLEKPRPANQYGFYSGFYPNGSFLVKGGKLPDHLVKTNSSGFRGREWNVTAPQGVRRALLVGDSVVWGAGIQREEDMLDRRLESELSIRDRGRWEGLNIAGTPAALWSGVAPAVVFRVGTDGPAGPPEARFTGWAFLAVALGLGLRFVAQPPAAAYRRARPAR